THSAIPLIDSTPVTESIHQVHLPVHRQQSVLDSMRGNGQFQSAAADLRKIHAGIYNNLPPAGQPFLKVLSLLFLSIDETDWYNFVKVHQQDNRPSSSD